ncbi:uncharacterized protein EAF01_009020 [Botrytis porri]|uniref:Uncharacterized protein n=1 Tax=Botrytis porri TaxID=87229 RepID=A0A4Z1KDJ5_9HELO|nr:uncharacterized protein EAF01_009020 [Botrytis porri]KAF7896617.1 hypothetical protein EAF01_009020 [Botrytis porri]TGO83730.1 hypothetical protein BPOR_0600g00010 [Botrytis porri]
MDNQHYLAPPAYTPTPPTSNPQNCQAFNATRWLLDTQRQYIQFTHYQHLLCQIFHASDHWWDEFLAVCDAFLRPRFSHSDTSVWNFYGTLQIHGMRSEYLTGGRCFKNETGEICNWLAFCLRELRNMGVEWNPNATRSSLETRREEDRSGERPESSSEREERREREQGDPCPLVEWWWEGDEIVFILS